MDPALGILGVQPQATAPRTSSRFPTLTPPRTFSSRCIRVRNRSLRKTEDPMLNPPAPSGRPGKAKDGVTSVTQRSPGSDQRSPDGNQLIVSYMFLRQTVGWIGTLLPFVLLFGLPISSTEPRPDSMSGYYYTDMRNIFVGALCALGVFLAAYDGYDDVDRWITNIAGLCAVGVAFCPTKPAVCAAGANLPGAVGHASVHQPAGGRRHSPVLRRRHVHRVGSYGAAVCQRGQDAVRTRHDEPDTVRAWLRAAEPPATSRSDTGEKISSTAPAASRSCPA